MPGILAQGTTVTINGVQWDVTAISVESPVAEIVDMTPFNAPGPIKRMMWTGAASSPGTITVDAIGAAVPRSLSGSRGALALSGPAGSLTLNFICSSASVEARTGDLYRVRFTLVETDAT